MSNLREILTLIKRTQNLYIRSPEQIKKRNRNKPVTLYKNHLNTAKKLYNSKNGFEAYL